MGDVINLFAARAGMDRSIIKGNPKNLEPMTLFMCSCGSLEFHLTNSGPMCVECHDSAEEWIDSMIADTSTPA